MPSRPSPALADIPPSSPGIGRRPELDALRGVAALMVLVGHAHLLHPPVATPDLPGAGFLRWLVFEHTPLRILDGGRPAVLFFFVLSGYVLTRALLASGSPGLAAFAVQRTLRLMLPVTASVLLSVGLYAAFFDPVALAAMGDRHLNTWLEPPTLRQVLGNALLLSTAEELRLNVPLWSLVQEWRLTLLLPLVLLFRGRALELLVLAFAAMLAGQVLGAREDEVQLGHDIRGSVASTLYFALGIGAGAALALAEPPPELVARHRVWLLALAVVLFATKSDLATYAGSAVLILLAQLPGRLRDALRWRPMVWLGRISFSLYLVHVPVLAAAAHALHGVASPLAAVAVGALLSLPAAALLRVAAEEPARRLARRAERALARPEAGRGRAMAR
jgi:peptidoglycan/LPS O-acetylase OafA/YrhL